MFKEDTDTVIVTRYDTGEVKDNIFITLDNILLYSIKYYKNGVIKSITNVHNDINIHTLVYNIEGMLIHELIHDTVYKKHIEYDLKGVIRRISNYKNNIANGEHINYFSNGKVKEKYSLVNGLIMGEYTSYLINGDVFMVLNYNELGLHGVSTKNDICGRVTKAIYSNGVEISDEPTLLQ